MDSRREFIRKAALLSGAAALPGVVPLPIQKALAIQAAPGSTFYDAEHVVILMQENRSFDHMFGKLKGVRGFNDPRAFTLPDKDKVWLQKDAKGNAYTPFHVDINKTKITWQGGLPHSWSDQTAARNGGRFDKWVPVKSSMCLGYYERTDIPFYYALADAFTICDHHFCASLTGTTPNRLFFWTGNIRPEPNGSSVAAVENSQAESRKNTWVDWDTFPELLEDNGIDWRIYQNELWTANLPGDTVDDWLGNYGDNPLEYVKRYQVKLSAYFRKNGDPTEKTALSAEEVRERYDKLSTREKNLIDKAFTTNIDAPFNYLELAPFTFTDDEGKEQTLNIPRHDIFHRFRSDVDNGKLPTVSWLVAPQRFSDHTSSPLYGVWYVSEVLDILTKNPEVWKKTIFILTYDENDGYFDHMPPYVVPRPGDPSTGRVSPQIDVAADYEHKAGSPIGLGYRVPMIVASPWSRGGYVNSQVFDHTSSLMFLENFLSKKTGRPVRSNMISNWRRNICGDLTSVFRPAKESRAAAPAPLKKEEVIVHIQNARNKPAQVKPDPLPAGESEKINTSMPFSSSSSHYMPQQEAGTSKACALPYLLSAESSLDAARDSLTLRFGAAATGHSTKAQGAPFTVYTPALYKGAAGKTWAYAVAGGEQLTDEWKLSDFENGRYDICITGPNGFFREFKGSAEEPSLQVNCLYEQKGLLLKKPDGNIALHFENTGQQALTIKIQDPVYKNIAPLTFTLGGGKSRHIAIPLKKSYGWYDVTVEAEGYTTYSRHYAGHVETGKDSVTDPYMGGLLR